MLNNYVCGIYRDGDGKRVFQVATDADDLSCELLANQFGSEDCIHWTGGLKVKEMIGVVKWLALQHNCDFVEINCKTREGGYRIIKIKNEKLMNIIGKWIDGKVIAERIEQELKEQGYTPSENNMKAVWLDILEHTLPTAIQSSVRFWRTIKIR